MSIATIMPRPAIRDQVHDILSNLEGPSYENWEVLDVCHDLLETTVLGHIFTVADIFAHVEEWMTNHYGKCANTADLFSDLAPQSRNA